jgi:hypothetical protein
MDDFKGLDIDEIQPKRPNKVNGKKKGNRTELELTKILTARFNMPFSRSVGSGNRWSQADLPQHASEVFSGDLICPKNFKFVIESKGGYDSIDMSAVFVNGNSELNGFLKQATADSNRCGRKPMMCWKKTRKPWLAFIMTNELIGHEFEYSLKYKEWTAIALDHLLKLNDDFFLNQT